MLQELTASVRRWAGLPISTKATKPAVGDAPPNAVFFPHEYVESLRGLTSAAADQAECTCPEACERDHANE
jgi:hypothetical protein